MSQRTKVAIKYTKSFVSAVIYRSYIVQIMTTKGVCCCFLSTEASDSDRLCTSSDHSQYQSFIDDVIIAQPSSLTASFESGTLSSSSAGHRYQLESRFSKSCKISDDGVMVSPQLDCFIIPSFGKDTPDNVAVKKMAGDFLRGVGKDYDLIKQLIKQDECKHLYEVEFMCHFAQKEVVVFKKTIKDAMADLKMKRKGCKCMHEEYRIYSRKFLRGPIFMAFAEDRLTVKINPMK